MTIERLSPRLSRRSGGREARRTLRAGPLADDLRPVRAPVCQVVNSGH